MGGAGHDLGGGGQFAFSDRICMDPTPNCAWLVDVKAKQFTLPRLKSFHYAVFANRGTSDTLTGQGERPGNDFYVSMGAKGYTQKQVRLLCEWYLRVRKSS